MCFILFKTEAQDKKPIEISIGNLKTELKQNATDVVNRYVQSLDILFRENDILLAGKSHLFQITPEINVQSGTDDAFSNINCYSNPTSSKPYIDKE